MSGIDVLLGLGAMLLIAAIVLVLDALHEMEII